MPLSQIEDRPVSSALKRGFRRKCPQCGTGAMMSGFLKVAHECPNCGLELHHQRADDGRAYLTILIVGHVLAPLMLYIFVAYRPDPLPFALGLSSLAIVLSLYLLPRLKGAMIGLQWAKHMHGF